MIVIFVDEADPLTHSTEASVTAIGVQCEASGSGNMETAEDETDVNTVS